MTQFWVMSMDYFWVKSLKIFFLLNQNIHLNFYHDFQKSVKIKLTILGKIKEKVHNKVNKLYNKSFENYDNEYNILSDVKKDKFDLKLKLINLKLKNYDCDEWVTEGEKELNEEEWHDLPPPKVMNKRWKREKD